MSLLRACLSMRVALGASVGACSLLLAVGGCGDDERAPPCTGAACLPGNRGSGGTGVGGGGSGGGNTGTSMSYSPDWVHGYGSLGLQFAHSVAIDSQGNVYTAGFFENSVEFADNLKLDAGAGWDMFLLKLSPTGVPIWAFQFDQQQDALDNTTSVVVGVGPDDQPVVASAITSDASVSLKGDAIILQGLQPDLFAVKLDADGGLVWQNHFAKESTRPAIRDIDFDAAGNVVLSGDLEGNGDLIDTPVAGFVAFVAKLDGGDGAAVWERQFIQDGSSQRGSTVAVDSEGNVLTAGKFRTTLEIFDETLTSARPLRDDIFLVKLDKDGNKVFVKQYGDVEPDVVNGLGVDSADNIYLAGYFGGTVDFGGTVITSEDTTHANAYVAKLDPTGATLWANGYGPNGTQEVNQLAIGPKDEVLVIGVFSEELKFGAIHTKGIGADDIFLGRLDTKGNATWAMQIGGKLDQVGISVAVGPAGQVAFAGRFEDTITMSTQPEGLVSGGGLDVLVGMLKPAEETGP